MGTIIALIIIFLIFIILCTIFFIIAISDARVSEKSALELYNNLPSQIKHKWVVRYNIGRPQGRFLKMKTFQGSGILYVENDTIKFEDILGNESHSFNFEECKLSWVENKINGITNAFKIIDSDSSMFFYVDKGMPIVNTIDGNESTSVLFSKLKTIKKDYLNNLK